MVHALRNQIVIVIVGAQTLGRVLLFSVMYRCDRIANHGRITDALATLR